MKNDFSLDRRDFIKFMGTNLMLAGVGSNILVNLAGCNTQKKLSSPLTPIMPGISDELLVSPELDYRLLIKWGEIINEKGDTFGFNNDYLAFFPTAPNRALLWVNHEYIHPLLVSGHTGGNKTRDMVELEMYNVGGSIVEVARQPESGLWGFVPRSNYNRRITGSTPIPFALGVKIMGENQSVGMVANCAGGVTPWGTVLTCEENYDQFYGERDLNSGKISKSDFDWETIFNHPPEHYGWVVEVDPRLGSCKKHTSMGRFAHESATVTVAKDGRIVVYSGDDTENEHLYKFISSKSDSLEQGELFVAHLEKGLWLSLDREKSDILKKEFKDQLDVLIHARRAAKLLGATPLDRPEDIQLHPQTKAVFVALTNNKKKNNYHGSILKIVEKNSDPLSLEFNSNHIFIGGEKTGFSCPDNLAFDKKGDLWMANDISGSSIGKNDYEPFGNNGLFHFSLQNENDVKIRQIARAPMDAEFTGPCFTPDYKTLFLSVQHPGERSKDLTQLTSHWPSGGDSLPCPGVVQIFRKDKSELYF